MAETAKILSPKKTVLLPDLKAGCSLADSCPPHLFKKFKEKYPDHLVITCLLYTSRCVYETETVLHPVHSILEFHQVLYYFYNFLMQINKYDVQKQ